MYSMRGGGVGGQSANASMQCTCQRCRVGEHPMHVCVARSISRAGQQHLGSVRSSTASPAPAGGGAASRESSAGHPSGMIYQVPARVRSCCKQGRSARSAAQGEHTDRVGRRRRRSAIKQQGCWPASLCSQHQRQVACQGHERQQQGRREAAANA